MQESRPRGPCFDSRQSIFSFFFYFALQHRLWVFILSVFQFSMKFVKANRLSPFYLRSPRVVHITVSSLLHKYGNVRINKKQFIDFLYETHILVDIFDLHRPLWNVASNTMVYATKLGRYKYIASSRVRNFILVPKYTKNCFRRS